MTQRLQALDPEALRALSETFDSSVRDSTPDELKKKAALVYGVCCILSVVWAMSGGLRSNVLGAEISLNESAGGTVTVTMRNEGTEAWTNVRVLVDGTYVRHYETIGAESAEHAPADSLNNTWMIPRDLGVNRFTFPNELGSPTAPANYQPQEVLLFCDQEELPLRLEVER